MAAPVLMSTSQGTNLGGSSLTRRPIGQFGSLAQEDHPSNGGSTSQLAPVEARSCSIASTVSQPVRCTSWSWSTEYMYVAVDGREISRRQTERASRRLPCRFGEKYTYIKAACRSDVGCVLPGGPRPMWHPRQMGAVAREPLGSPSRRCSTPRNGRAGKDTARTSPYELPLGGARGGKNKL